MCACVDLRDLSIRIPLKLDPVQVFRLRPHVVTRASSPPSEALALFTCLTRRLRAQNFAWRLGGACAKNWRHKLEPIGVKQTHSNSQQREESQTEQIPELRYPKSWDLPRWDPMARDLTLVFRANLSHNQNLVSKWSTQNYVKN